MIARKYDLGNLINWILRISILIILFLSWWLFGGEKMFVWLTSSIVSSVFSLIIWIALGVYLLRGLIMHSEATENLALDVQEDAGISFSWMITTVFLSFSALFLSIFYIFDIESTLDILVQAYIFICIIHLIKKAKNN